MITSISQSLKRGDSAYEQGKFTDAVYYYKKVLESRPNHGFANHNLGLAFVQIGDVEIGLDHIKRAIDCDPKCENFWITYVSVLSKNGNEKLAKTSIKKAKKNGICAKTLRNVAVNSKLPTNWISLSSVSKSPDSELSEISILLKDGHSKLAYERAVSLQANFPRSAIVLNLLGIICKYERNLEGAIGYYTKALMILPEYPEVLFNLGNALRDSGSAEAALDSYDKAIRLQPDYPEASTNMALLIESGTLRHHSVPSQKIISRLLENKWFGSPRMISQSAFHLLKLDPLINKYIDVGYDGLSTSRLLSLIDNLYASPLFTQLMTLGPICDREIENMLIAARSSILLSLFDLKADVKVLHFLSLLAHQCFINEYVFYQTPQDTQLKLKLEELTAQNYRSGCNADVINILCLACFSPLSSYKWSSKIHQNDSLDGLIRLQIVEPREEALLIEHIPSLSDISDTVSKKVAAQYNQSPYPRWVNVKLELRPTVLADLEKNVRIRLFDKEIEKIIEPEILVAGCGTGEHPINTASMFTKSKILAVDLSFSSLAYAKRKTDELGFENIKYMHADILDLGKLDRKFDIIECCGVLHHMEDPLAGWVELVNCLKPGGLMLIGLYSSLARQDIVRVRNEIESLNVDFGFDIARDFRRELLNSDAPHHRWVSSRLDFNSMSGLRDLLFNVQERRFSITEIDSCMKTLGLHFCGFSGANIIDKFLATNTSESSLFDLSEWSVFEELNPYLFSGMYQFWCQKP